MKRITFILIIGLSTMLAQAQSAPDGLLYLNKSLNAESVRELLLDCHLKTVVVGALRRLNLRDG